MNLVRSVVEKPLIGFSMLLAVSSVAACGSDGPFAPRRTVATIEISTVLPAIIAPSETLQLVAVARDDVGQPVLAPELVWASETGTVATVTLARPLAPR